MPMRVIDAPGIQINEIDKSGYSPAMTGSKCYVMGYSQKGTPYTPMIFTSKAAWQSFYGDPSNEAEKYFYNACTEVINQNGVLNCARIPYQNKAKDKMVGYKFKVSTSTTENPTAGAYLSKDSCKSYVDHNADFEMDALEYVINNKCYREIDNKDNGLETETEIKEFYRYAADAYNNTYNKMLEHQRHNVSYYEVDVEKSLALSARFISRKQAQEYIREFNNLSIDGKLYYYTDEEKCIIDDMHDWIAQPLYCVYNKEALVSADYTGKSMSELESVKRDSWIQAKRCKDADLAISCTIKGTTTVIDSVDKITTYDILTCLVDKMLTQRTTKDIVEMDKVKDIDTTLKMATKEKVGQEIKSTSYAEWRKTKLDIKEINVPYLKIYSDEGVLLKNPEVINRNYKQFIEPKFTTEGANNEFLFNNTVNTLYHDSLMKLDKDPNVSAVYEELWVPYYTQNLSSILRYSAKSESKYITSWADMLSTFKKEGGIKFTDIIGKYNISSEKIKVDVPYHSIADLDETLNDYFVISQSELPITCDLTAVDEYRTGEAKVASNTFWIFDKTCDELKNIVEDDRKGDKRQMIGIFPVITTAANALYAQSLIDVGVDEVINYETVNGTITKSYNLDDAGDITSTNKLLSSDITMRFSQLDKTADEKDNVIDTVSRDANNFFLPIQMNPTLTGVDTENMKKIGVVVYKAYLDASEGNKVSFTAVESFVGSLDKDAKNPNTKVSTFIDNIVNTRSDYIYFFSNCLCNKTVKKIYDEQADFFVCKNGVTGMLGFFQKETKKTISLPSIYQGIDKCFQKVEDINERDIDIVCDAGLANIAQFIKSVYGGAVEVPMEYDLGAVDEVGDPMIKLWTCKSASDVNAWKTVEFKYDNFCKNVRKDCMFIADGPRPLVLQGEKKIVRDSKPSNTIDANIIPNVKFITGLNTNYGAGYCDWFQVTDEFTGDEMWLPPSIKAMGVYINTDLNFNYWDAPAGLNRGVIQALDCAFSPTIKQAGQIYTKNWNYAINYPNDGIVLEGQKTFQVKPSSLDRVNARRTLLRLERAIGKVLRYFIYEGNTTYVRQRVVDMVTPYLQEAKVGGGLYDFKVICDSSNNTPTTIDRNELHISVGLKVTKTIEFIMCNFILASTGASWDEVM